MIFAESLTDKGLRAELNQDAVLSVIGERVSLFCVADGMGGHEHGELASAAIVNRLNSWHGTVENEEMCDFINLLDDFETCISDANREIHDELTGAGICGSTLVALLIAGKRYAVFSAGDSRVYRRRKGKLTQLTTDDIWENRADIASQLSENMLSEDSHFGELTKAVGVYDEIILSRVTGELHDRDVFLLCSDGVYKNVSKRMIAHAMRTPVFGGVERFIQTEIRKLESQVIGAGAPDNYSILEVCIRTKM